jgi:mono/diheme cytochrome c family protein
MGKKQEWTKRGLTALMAAAFLSTAPGIVLADHHEGMAEAAKGMAQEAAKDMATDAAATATDTAAAVTGVTAEQGPGQQAFNQYCASCHGTDAKGKGPVADTLKKEPADLTQISKKNGGEFDSGDVARMIDGQRDVAGHGPREMPVWGVEFAESVSKGNQGSIEGARYANASIVQLVRYIESIQE